MFCSNCGKRIQNNAKFCMYCGTPVGDIANNEKDEITTGERCSDAVEEDFSYDDYSNCENGKISFPKMFRKFFSKNIKEYFSFKGTYSRLEYFYARSIIYIAILSVIVPCMAVPNLYMLIAVPITVAFIWLLTASYVKRLKDLNVTLWVMLIPPTCGILMDGDEDEIKLIGIIVFIFYTAYVMFLPGEKFRQEEDEFIDEKNENKENQEDAEKQADAEVFSIKDGRALLIIATAIMTAIITKLSNN